VSRVPGVRALLALALGLAGALSACGADASTPSAPPEPPPAILDPAVPIADTTWLVAALGDPDTGGSFATTDPQVDLHVAPDGTVTGHTGCNDFRTSVTVRADAISFGPVATTHKPCNADLARQEAGLLAALARSDRIRKGNGGGMWFYAGDEVTLTLIRLLERLPPGVDTP
jgi:heat shock protein HslJ